MPKSTNKFLEAVCYDHVVVSADDNSKIGELRIKPSSVLWKPKSAQKYHSVSLDDFAEWIVKNGKLVDK